MRDHAQPLDYAVRFRVVSKYVGQVCLALAVLTLVPLAAAFFFGDERIGLRYAGVVALLAGLGGALAHLRTPNDVRRHEGMVIAAVVFFIAPLAMVFPMMASGLSLPDAVFEAVSGATTTGLSTCANVHELSATFLFTRAWMQWYGGLGVVVLSMAWVATPGLVAKRLVGEPRSDEDLVGGTRAYARRIVRVYAALTALGIAALWACGVGPFNALVYTFAAVSTGGFSPHDNGLAGLGGWMAPTLVTLLCIAGAIPLTFYSRRHREKGRLNVEGLQLGALLACGLAVTLALAVCWGMHGASAASIVRHAPLLAFSAQSTAGFATVSVPQLDAGSKAVLIATMLIGGGVGSTAGGFKLLRLLILGRVLQVVVRRTGMAAHAVLDPRLADHRLGAEEVSLAMLTILLFVGVVVLSWFPFVAMGFDPLNSLFEVASATGTVGLSAGITGRNLPTLLKGVLCADMWLGRLEIMAWLVVLRPGTWLSKRTEAA